MIDSLAGGAALVAPGLLSILHGPAGFALDFAQVVRFLQYHF
jgi:hypothetical protein